MPTSYPNSRTKGITFGAAALRMSLSSKAKRITVSATEGCFIDFYRDAVAEDSFYIPADTPTDIDILYPSFISVIQETGAGVLTVMEGGDVVLFERIRGWFTSNASLLLVGNTVISGDSSIKKVVAATATANSNLEKEISDTASADANLAATYGDTATGDASIKAVVSGSATGDCTLIP